MKSRIFPPLRAGSHLLARWSVHSRDSAPLRRPKNRVGAKSTHRTVIRIHCCQLEYIRNLNANIETLFVLVACHTDDRDTRIDDSHSARCTTCLVSPRARVATAPDPSSCTTTDYYRVLAAVGALSWNPERAPRSGSSSASARTTCRLKCMFGASSSPPGWAMRSARSSRNTACPSAPRTHLRRVVRSGDRPQGPAPTVPGERRRPTHGEPGSDRTDPARSARTTRSGGCPLLPGHRVLVATRAPDPAGQNSAHRPVSRIHGATPRRRRRLTLTPPSGRRSPRAAGRRARCAARTPRSCAPGASAGSARCRRTRARGRGTPGRPPRSPR